MINKDITIVSAFFDIGRANWQGDVGARIVPNWLARSNETYLAWFRNLAALRNQMVIFTEQQFAQAILDSRREHGLEQQTTVMVCDGLFAEHGPLADSIRNVKSRMRPDFHEFVSNPACPEYWNANYVLLNALKPVFACTAIELRLNRHQQVAWIDFGYCRDDKRFDPATPWRYDFGERMNLFHIREPDDRPVFDIVRSGDVYFQGCHLVGPAEAWFSFRDLMDQAITSLLAAGLVDDDQTAILMVYRQAPEQFQTHAVAPGDWFVVLRDFCERDTEGEAEVRRRPAVTGEPPIFIHASWRTASTWFWSKFRELPETTGYFEPFGALLDRLTREQVMEWDYEWWDSGHPPGPPYCEEFLPLMRKSGGVRLFHPDIPDNWFIPGGGLRGELRQPEKRFLSLLIRHADRGNTVPVLGFTNSLGRIWPLKQTFGGFHIFQYRNLWSQWLSYVEYRNHNYPCFYESVAELISRDDDAYLAEIAQIYQDKLGKSDPDSPVRWQALLRLPVNDVFSLFMALHIYLYLHGELVADLSVDATGLARDLGYRRYIEQSISEATGLAVSFDDAQDAERFAADESLQIDAIDWAEIRRHAQAAAEALSGLGDPKRLSERAMAYVDGTMAEARAPRSPRVADARSLPPDGDANSLGDQHG